MLSNRGRHEHRKKNEEVLPHSPCDRPFREGKGSEDQNERTVHNTARKDKQERVHARTQVEWEVQYTSNSCSCTPMVQRNLSSAVVAFCSALWLTVSRPRTSAIVGMALAYDKKLPHSLVQGSRWHKIG